MATGRRSFLKKSSLGALGSLFVPGLNKSETAKPGNEIAKIQSYRPFGKTGFMVSDVATGAPENEAILRVLLKAGVNFIDTSELYGNGNNERLIGNVMKEFDRDKVFIATKIYAEEAFKDKQQVIGKVNQCLERLQMEYVDCVMIHHVDRISKLKDEAYHEGIKQLKAEGKVGYSGLSCHGSAWIEEPVESLDKILMAAVEDGRFDVFLMTYNFLNAPLAGQVLDACHEKGMATAIMKSNPVRNYYVLKNAVEKREEKGEEVSEKLRAYYNRYVERLEKARAYFGKMGFADDEAMKEAAFRYVLDNPKANTLCISFNDFQDVEKYLAISGKGLESQQQALLEAYKEHLGFLTCRVGCNECEKSCPGQLPVNDILRYQYYFESKKKEKYAMQLYHDLGTSRATACKDCPGYCEEACPYGVATREMMLMAHEQLSLENISRA